MPQGAVGVEQVGGVTTASKGMVGNADTRVQGFKTLNAISDGTEGRMVGPAGILMRGAMSTHAGASGMAGVNGAEVAVSFARGEKAVDQGVLDSIQEQKVSMTDAETTYSALSKPISA
jgi:hypothetical protein